MSYACKALITTATNIASRDKRLSIGLMADGFSFAETMADGTLLSFGQAEGIHSRTMTAIMADIKGFFASVGVRPLGYGSMQLVVFSEHSTWVPDEVYSSLANRKYLGLVGCSTEQSILTYHSDSLGSTALFTAAEQLVTSFKVCMPGVSVMHQHAKMAGMAKYFGSTPTLLLHVWQGKADVAVFREGQYYFGNTWPIHSREQLVYQLVELMKSASIESPDTVLQLCGDVDRDLYAACRPYFPNTSLFCGIDADAQASPFDNFHFYRHALLFA